MPTRIQIRERSQRRGLLQLGKTTAAGATTYLVDTVRQGMERLDPTGGQWLRLRTAEGSSTDGYLGQVLRIDTTNGRIYVTPALPIAVGATASVYEIWEDVNPDDWDRALDRALTTRCSDWVLRPASLEDPVEDWTSQSGATLTETTGAFPEMYQRSSLRVANSGADGYATSDAITVQPGQRIRVFGWVSVAAQTASVKVFNNTGSAYLTVQGTSIFTLKGWQFFEVYVDIPAGCGEIYVRIGGASASCDAYWSGLGILRDGATHVLLPSIVESKAAVGRVFSRTQAGAPPRPDTEEDEVAAGRQTRGSLVALYLPGGINGALYYEHREFYSALASDYYTIAQRKAGDDSSTTCPLKYAEAAAVVELLESSEYQGGIYQNMYTQARRDLSVYERDFGPQPKVLPAPGRRSPRMSRL